MLDKQHKSACIIHQIQEIKRKATQIFSFILHSFHKRMKTYENFIAFLVLRSFFHLCSFLFFLADTKKNNCKKKNTRKDNIHY